MGILSKIFNLPAKIFNRNPGTPEEQLVRAIIDVQPKKVKKLLETGVDANMLTATQKTPLDLCVDVLDDQIGTPEHKGNMGPGALGTVRNLSLIWRDLVKCGGKLNKYDDIHFYHKDMNLKFATFIAVPWKEEKEEAPAPEKDSVREHLQKLDEIIREMSPENPEHRASTWQIDRSINNLRRISRGQRPYR